MLRYYEGTVFNSEAKWLVNTVNCVGVMGAGIALEFRLRYPEMFEDYVAKCADNTISIGKIGYYENEKEETYIVNFPTKHHFKYPSQMSWIEEGLKNFVATYKEHGINSVAFSMLGCGKGGLEWGKVRPLMEKHLSAIDADVVICLDNEKEAKGKEKEMVDMFNQTTVDSLALVVRLSEKQKVTLEAAKPLARFFRIAALPGIGSTSYEKLFRYFYTKDISEYGEQLSLL